MKPLVLVDGSSYLFRAFHALPALTNSKGEPTGALHGVLNMVAKLVRETEPDQIAVVFDASGKTFRDDIYAEYKANRPPMPDELRSQIQPLHEIIQAMGLPLISVPGVEADDVIGTLAAAASAAGQPCLVSTSDKDMAQLVNEHVTLVNTMSDTEMDRDGVFEKFAVWPEQIIDWLALVGDSSDNIPGVPKVGPKTAAKWLAEHGDVQSLMAAADSIKGKVGESLRDNFDNLVLSQTLATIKCDVALERNLGELQPSEPDVEKLREYYQRWELRTLLRNLDSSASDDTTTSATTDDSKYETILNKADFTRWYKKLVASPLVALDTETTSLNYMEAELVGLSFSTEPGEAAYLPVAHNYVGAPEQLDREWVLDQMREWLEDPNANKVGHHLKYDAHIFRRYDIRLAGIQHDTMLQSYVLNSTATRHDMDSVATRYLGVTTTHYEDVAGKGAKQVKFDQVDVDIASHYAAEDADITLKLHAHLYEALTKEPALLKVYESLEMPLVDVLISMEEHGVALDADLLAQQSKALAQEAESLQLRAHELADAAFNLGSPKQLQEILFEQQGLPVIRKTPKGQPSTAEDVLQELANDYELPAIILDYRSVTKLRSTYTEKLPLERAADGRVHTSYHQAVAATGRLSSSDPNLQNIPIRTPAGRRIREAFVAPPGTVLLAADYSQIELRIMAHLSGDKSLVSAFREDRDVHQATAAEVFEVELANVTADQRRSAKAINFGLMYGMSAFGLAKQLGIGRGEAQTYIDQYFDRYPGVAEFMDAIRERAREQGYVSTVGGRRLYLPEINARNPQRRQYAERTAINAPMQGTAADIIKQAMIDVQQWLSDTDVDARLIMQVHDELVLEVAEAAAPAVAADVVKLMVNAARLDVPLKVDFDSGPNWNDAH